jgi:hypothetical protein
MKLLKKIALMTFATTAVALFGTSCEGDSVVKRETTTTSSPYGVYGGSTSSTTTTIIAEED